jgi:hypothetical protein
VHALGTVVEIAVVETVGTGTAAVAAKLADRGAVAAAVVLALVPVEAQAVLAVYLDYS